MTATVQTPTRRADGGPSPYGTFMSRHGSLMPTASVSTPSAVRRSTRATTAIAATEMKSAKGSPTT